MIIASCHWYAVALAAQSDSQQQRLASLGGGAGLAYVFVHLLPELASGGSELSETIGMIPYATSHLIEALLFLIALLGVLVVFSIDVLAQRQTFLFSISSWPPIATVNKIPYSIPVLINEGRE